MSCVNYLTKLDIPSVVVLSVAAPLLPLKILPATSVISPEKFKQKVESGLGQKVMKHFFLCHQRRGKVS
jgi:hypothetical protein